VTAICGVIGRDGRPCNRRDIARALTGLTPLGHHGLHDWAGSAGDMGVAVGVALRRRVAEDAVDEQPAHDPPAGQVLVADAVLTNRSELAGLLGLADKPDVPDSRFLLAAYQRWGRDCLERLCGAFAFALVDRIRGAVLLARDHVGERPLHVHTGAGQVSFASTALALTDVDGVGHDLDAGRLAQYLAGVHATGRSWVAGVHPVPPGSALWVETAGIRHWRYWSVAGIEANPRKSAAKHTAALRIALDTAVAAAASRGKPVGVALSGGLDSTSVAATAAGGLALEPVLSYTAVPAAGWRGSVPPGYEADEASLVALLASRHRNLVPHFADAVGVPFFGGYEDIFDAGGTPPSKPCNLTWMERVFQAASADGIGTLLTGAGGSAYFSADDERWLAALVRHGRLLAATREGRAWMGTSGARGRQVLRGALSGHLSPAAAHRWWQLLPSASRRAATSYWYASSALRPELRGQVDLSTVTVLLAGGPAAAAAAGPLTLAGHASGAELRAAVDAQYGFHRSNPCADVRVIEVAAAQPPWVRRNSGVTRAACRAAMADRLPAEIRLRSARGMQLPDWLDRMTEARVELSDELAAIRDDPVATEFIDVERLSAAMIDWPDPTPAAAAAPDLTATYRRALLTALLAGRYVRWFESRRTASLFRGAAALRSDIR
jgi:asparagine synthase (glutamine-hydrolysing)